MQCAEVWQAVTWQNVYFMQDFPALRLKIQSYTHTDGR